MKTPKLQIGNVRICLFILVLFATSCSKQNDSLSDNDPIGDCQILKDNYSSTCGEIEEEVILKVDQIPTEILERIELEYLAIDTLMGIYTNFCKISDTILLISLMDKDLGHNIHGYDRCLEEVLEFNEIKDSIYTYKVPLRELLNIEVRRIDFIWQMKYLNNDIEYLVGIENDDCNPTACVYEVNFDSQEYCLTCK